MTTASPPNVTELLQAWSGGDKSALENLIPLVYDELHRLAKRYIGRERPGHTLQTTALVNEAYLRLIDAQQVEWQNRAHFFAISAQLMRRILVDFARAKRFAKRGGQNVQVSLAEAILLPQERDADLVALDEALAALTKVDERKARGVEETAEVLKVSPETVMRDWKVAKVWLLRELKKENDEA